MNVLLACVRLSTLAGLATIVAGGAVLLAIAIGTDVLRGIPRGSVVALGIAVVVAVLTTRRA